MRTERFRTVNAGSCPSRCSFDAPKLQRIQRFCLHRTQVSHPSEPLQKYVECHVHELYISRVNVYPLPWLGSVNNWYHITVQPVGHIPKARTLLFSRFNHLVAVNDNMCTRYIIHHACMHTITTPIVHCAKKRASPARSCRVRDKEEWVDYVCEHCHAASRVFCLQISWVHEINWILDDQ